MLDDHAYAFKLAKQFAISRLLFAVCHLICFGSFSFATR